MRGSQANEDHQRERICAYCGLRFIQPGPGRNRKACYRPRCVRSLKGRSRMPRTMFGTLAQEWW